MGTVYKVLGQVCPSATTLMTLYTVPAATSTIVSSITVSGLTASANFRIAVRPAGAAIADQHYIAYDAIVNAGDTIALTLGITVAATDVISVYASTATVAFSIFGSELT